MKKKLLFFVILLSAFCLLSAAAAAGEAGDAKRAARLPARLSEIGEEAFAGTSFEALELPSSIRSVGAGAFADMPNLSELRFPKTARIVAGPTFAGLTGRIPRPEQPVRPERIDETEMIPAGRSDTKELPDEEQPTGTAGESRGSGLRAAGPEAGPVNHPLDGEAFHPLRLRFP